MPLGANKAAIMGVAGTAAAADVVLLHDTDYSNVATASITSGITSTYGEYIFKFYNINPATDSADFSFQCSTDGGSSYGLTITTTYFECYHAEDDSATNLGYSAGQDLEQSTSFQGMSFDIGSGADESTAGELHIFNPSSTTYVKHFYGVSNVYGLNNFTIQEFYAGYFNTTSDIDAIQFKMNTGNFDGTIKMWGVK